MTFGVTLERLQISKAIVVPSLVVVKYSTRAQGPDYSRGTAALFKMVELPIELVQGCTA